MRKISQVSSCMQPVQPAVSPRLPAADEERMAMARRTLAVLGSSVGWIAAATRDPTARDVWLDVWARHIREADLTAAELAAGLARLHDAPANTPIGWQQFYQCCRPPDVMAADLEARKRNLPALPDAAAVQRRIDAARRAFSDPRLSKYLPRVSPHVE